MINKLGVVLVCFLLQTSDGCGSQPAKVEKSKKLALKALARL